MPDEQTLFLSDLLAQEEPNPDSVVDTIRDCAKLGMAIKPEEVQELIEKTRLDGFHLTRIYQSLVRAGLDEKIPYKTRQGYGDVVMYLQKKIDVVNPKPEKRGDDS